MKTVIKIIAGLGVAAAVVPSVASAQPWQSINQRQDRIEKRIDQGIRSGALNRREAVQLRRDVRNLTGLEARYRVGGLSNWERQDLNRRFDALAAKVRFQKNDRQYRR
jgi:tetrahydromethanopterin S-methyltransferase subunit G